MMDEEKSLESFLQIPNIDKRVRKSIISWDKNRCQNGHTYSLLDAKYRNGNPICPICGCGGF